MRKIFLLVVLAVLLTSTFAQAQDDEQPYLYYYSRLLGGLIIEHPDGSDSRLIGAEVIPPGLLGIGGPGWSPSGNYFAAYGIDGGAYAGIISLIHKDSRKIFPSLHFSGDVVLHTYLNDTPMVAHRGRFAFGYHRCIPKFQ